MNESKCILDNVPQTGNWVEPTITAPFKIENDSPEDVVSGCPHCGAPIYGPKKARPSERIHVRYTCLCRNKGGLEIRAT